MSCSAGDTLGNLPNAPGRYTRFFSPDSFVPDPPSASESFVPPPSFASPEPLARADVADVADVAVVDDQRPDAASHPSRRLHSPLRRHVVVEVVEVVVIRRIVALAALAAGIIARASIPVASASPDDERRTTSDV
jgi:hypothetical protein